MTPVEALGPVREARTSGFGCRFPPSVTAKRIEFLLFFYSPVPCNFLGVQEETNERD